MISRSLYKGGTGMDDKSRDLIAEQNLDIDEIVEKIDEEKTAEFYEKSSAEAEDILSYIKRRR